MTQRVLILALVACFAVSCNNDPAQESSASGKDFFPLASVIEDQWNLIDSLKLPVVKVITEHGKSDTLAASIEELRRFGQVLLKPDVTRPPLSSNYAESSFADQSIPSITLSYSTADEKLPVQRLDILLQPDPVSTDKLRNVYMEKYEGAQSKKILLIANNSLQVITNTNDSAANIVKFLWYGL